MQQLTAKDLLNARVHLGHVTSRWNPSSAPFIFEKRNGIHLIDLNHTLHRLQRAQFALRHLASAGKKILFVATKKQAKAIVEAEAKRLQQPYMTEKWRGGTLTNFATQRKSLKKLASLESTMRSSAYQNLAKREQLMESRKRARLTKLLGGIQDLNRLPAALVIVDINREHIAVKEAKKIGIPVFALTDTNTDPNLVDYPIPANDDACSSIALLVKALGESIEAGLHERKNLREEAVGSSDTSSNASDPEVAKPHARRVASTRTAQVVAGSKQAISSKDQEKASQAMPSQQRKTEPLKPTEPTAPSSKSTTENKPKQTPATKSGANEQLAETTAANPKAGVKDQVASQEAKIDQQPATEAKPKKAESSSTKTKTSEKGKEKASPQQAKADQHSTTSSSQQHSTAAANKTTAGPKKVKADAKSKTIDQQIDETATDKKPSKKGD